MLSKESQQIPKDELWHAIGILEVYKKVKSSPRGISDLEAKRRLEKFGLNALPRRGRISWLSILLRQFYSPLVYLLLIAAGVSFFLDDFTDAYIILAAVALSVGFG